VSTPPGGKQLTARNGVAVTAMLQPEKAVKRAKGESASIVETVYVLKMDSFYVPGPNLKATALGAFKKNEVPAGQPSL